ncbi:EAL domain-containing protein [Neptunomonas sp.]|uniref:bifunctional diguanylate cyclase/phosphodiesterase n=1 Tax=Neptunomonas sp. TaxID=1971898 RepID=UPI0025D9F924|nr:EAL domain-containing protein [Neptunomonas sp.]
MTLNKRISLLILPVLIVGYMIAVIGVYNTQKKSIIALEERTLSLQVAELTGLFEKYTNVAEGFIDSLLYSSSLQNYFSSQDKQFKALALEKGLANSIRELNSLSSDYFSVALIRPQGKVEYYYENSIDPFSYISNYQIKKAREVFDSNQSGWAEVYDTLGGTHMLFIRIIDQNTFKTPIDFSIDSSIAIVVEVNPSLFDNKIKDHMSEGLVYQWFDEEHSGDHHSGEYLVIHSPVAFGSLSLGVPEKLLAEKLNKLKLSLFLSFVLIAVLSYLSLIYLIQRYITGPIRTLEKELSNVRLEGGDGFVASVAEDEVGRLSRAFSRLYDSLDQSYRLTKELAEKDTLTKLHNRRMFHNAVEKMLKRSELSGTRTAIYYIDIDNFKFVNDTYGHTMGDLLLKEFAERLSLVVRASDQVAPQFGVNDTSARLAGDEFAVVTSGLKDELDASGLANRILEICEHGFTCDEGVFPVSLSIGVAVYPDDGVSTDELVNNADAAMYEAKKAGKNQISFYSEELADKSRRKYAVEFGMKHLNASELELVYMPAFNVDEKETICSVEAGIRWNSPVLGNVLPSEFLPIAEGSSQYEKIDIWVVERVFKDSRALIDHFGGALRISFKVSAVQLVSKSFIKVISQLIAKYKINPQNFEIEITEIFDMDKMKDEIGLLFLLKDLGFKLALVDFGAGFTSIMQLIEYPVEIVKLDKIFVSSLLVQGRKEKAIALIEFCKVQGLEVTAKGVESDDQVNTFKEAGCKRLQGPYYTEPMSLEMLLSHY